MTLPLPVSLGARTIPWSLHILLLSVWSTKTILILISEFRTVVSLHIGSASRSTLDHVLDPLLLLVNFVNGPLVDTLSGNSEAKCECFLNMFFLLQIFLSLIDHLCE